MRNTSFSSGDVIKIKYFYYMIFSRVKSLSARLLAGYVLAIMLVGLVPAWPNFAEAATSTLFEDGFEAAGTPFSSWDTSDAHWSTTGSDTHSGSKKAKVVGNENGVDILATTIDTTGQENVSLSFWYRYTNLADTDTVEVEWFDGTNWNLIDSYSNGTVSDWTEKTADLPAEADDNADFAIRFVATISSGNVTFYLDDVNISGDEIVVNTTSSETVVVRGDTTTSVNQPEVGWMFNRDTDNQTPFEFNKDEASIGAGSLFVAPITNTVNGNSDKFIGELYLYEDVANINSISYDFELANGSESKEAHFYANAYVTLPAPNSWYDCRYNIVPTSGSTGSFTTITFDPNESYDVVSKVPASYVCPSSPADLPEGSTLNFFVLNVGDTSANDAGVSGYLDNVVTVIKNGTNTHTTTYDFEPAPTSNVTLCKYDTNQNPLEGWTLNLLGNKVEDLNVPSNIIGGVNTSATLVDGASYVAFASGTWDNHGGAAAGANTADAEYITTKADWSNNYDGPTVDRPYSLELQINDADIAWGPYSSLHTYATSFIGTGAVANFRVFDGQNYAPVAGWYNDNSGSLSVSLYEGFSGITDNNGCVTFSDVPYGDYTVDEVGQAGWYNVSGLESATVDQELEQFDVVNTDDEFFNRCSVTVVSDDTNTVTEKGDAYAKVLTFVHTAWTAVIDGAEWIWGDNPVSDPTTTETETFVKTFEWSGGVAVANLDIATDNYYTITINGVEVASTTALNNFQTSTQDNYDVSSYIQTGENTLEIKVTNLGVVNSNYKSNPAGLKYNLTVISTDEGDACMYAPTNPGLEITNPDSDGQTLAGEFTFTAEYVDADTIKDGMQWAIRAGTCAANTGTVYGNVDGHNDAFNWDGVSFSTTVDMSAWANGDYCLVVNPKESSGTNFRETRWFVLENIVPSCTLDVVSGVGTVVVESQEYAVATWDEHHNWTHSIPGATWIWDTFFVENPESDETKTFSESFVANNINDATLYIAADNEYKVYINGTLAYEDASPNNYQSEDVYTGVESYLNSGTENTIEVEVTNNGTENSTAKSNPAGTLFKLVVNAEDSCEITTVAHPELTFGPYCGDDEINQDWEQCELGDEGCLESCQWENQCHFDQLVKIDLDDTIASSASWDGKVYLGAIDKLAPIGHWFNVADFGTETAVHIANTADFDGLALDYDGSQMRFAWKGGNKSGVIDYVQGDISFLGFADITNDDISGEINGSGSYKLEWYGVGFKDIFETTSSSSVTFDMRADTGNDGATIALTPTEGGYGQCTIDEPTTYKLEGYKWNDEDGDGEWGDGENTIAGWTIYATNGENSLSTTTDEGGYYYFDVDGDYTWEVYEATSTNWTQTGIEVDVYSEGDGYTEGESCFFDIYANESESDYALLECNFGNYYEEETSTETTTTGGGGGGGHSATEGYSMRHGGTPSGQVLGASIDTCEQYLYETIMPGRDNNSSEVRKLQEFLNSFEGYNLEVTGVYDEATQKAVGEFQEKYTNEILTPWGLTSKTLNVYYTTRKTINEIYCKYAIAFPLSDEEQTEVDWFRGLGILYRNGVTVSERKDDESGVNGGGDAGSSSEGSSNEESNNEEGDNNEGDSSNQSAAAAAAGDGFWNKLAEFFKSWF